MTNTRKSNTHRMWFDKFKSKENQNLKETGIDQSEPIGVSNG